MQPTIQYLPGTVQSLLLYKERYHLLATWMQHKPHCLQKWSEQYHCWMSEQYTVSFWRTCATSSFVEWLRGKSSDFDYGPFIMTWPYLNGQVSATTTPIKLWYETWYLSPKQALSLLVWTASPFVSTAPSDKGPYISTAGLSTFFVFHYSHCFVCGSYWPCYSPFVRCRMYISILCARHRTHKSWTAVLQWEWLFVRRFFVRRATIKICCTSHKTVVKMLIINIVSIKTAIIQDHVYEDSVILSNCPQQIRPLRCVVPLLLPKLS